MVGLVPTRNTAEVDLVARLHELSRTGTHSRMLLDREGRIVWVNNGFERMTGLSAAQACGQTPPQLLQPPNADACARTDFTARIVEGQAFRLEIEIRGPDGASTWGDLHVRPLHGEDGGVEGFTGLLIESSETHRLQEQLKAAATSLSSAAELARLGGWEVDLRRNEVRLSLELNAILGRPRLVEPIDGALNLYVEDERERVGGLIGAAIAGLYFSGTFPLWESIVHGFFQTASIVTDNGLVAAGYPDWPMAVTLLLLLGSFFGGCVGSTCGGIKAIRFLLLYRQSVREMKLLIRPTAQIPVRLGTRTVPDRVMQAVLAFYFLYIFAYCACSIGVAATGADLVTAFGSVAGCINNMGVGLGETASNFSPLSDTATWIVTASMLIGRLEVFPLLLLFVPSFWR